MYTKSLYIAVDPVGSKFAKGIQQQLRSITHNKIYRVSQQRADRKQLRRAVFRVTPRTLNKIEQFERFRAAGVSSPSFATSVQNARGLGAKTLFARTLINSTNGRGIIEFDTKDEHYPRAPLYTEYIPKKAEYRVHVFGDRVIDIQQKKKKRGFDDERDTRIRNMANGYVYCRDGIAPPAGINDLAIKAVQAVGYQYGAVDIIYNEKRNQCFVLEVNSRPGLLGTTLENYASALANLYDLRKK